MASKKKTILGLKITAGSEGSGPAVGWAVVEQSQKDAMESRKNISEDEIMLTARKKIGEYIQSIRMGKDLTLYAVSKASGLRIEQLQGIEAGDTSYTIDTFLKVCRALDCYFILKNREGKHLDEAHLLCKMQD